MADLPEAVIDAPIAGQSLTSEVGGWPWEQPPQYTTVEEALEFYVPRLTEPTLQNELMDVIEMGLPLTTIANSLQQGAVMQGKHSLDVGILVMPVIMEMIQKMQGADLSKEFKIKLSDFGIKDVEEAPAPSFSPFESGELPMPSSDVVQTAQATPNVMNTGLTPAESALLSEEEKMIKLRDRGLA